MSTKRIAASCAVMALAVCAGSWVSVRALGVQTQGADRSTAGQSAAGPLERRANPVTPENPIPRRVSHVEAEYPPEAADAGAQARITLRVTIDESGRVAEARPFGMSWRLENPQMTGSFQNVSQLEDAVRGTPRFEGDVSGAGGRSATTVLNAFVRAATDAVRQWQYDPPFKAPISFNVTVHFGDVPPPPPPPPPPPAPAGRADRVPGMPPPPPPPPPPPVRPGDTRKTPGVPPPPPPPPRSEQHMADDTYDSALRVGRNIKAPDKIRHVEPVYPEVARAAGVQGVVIVEVRIEPDGTVSNVKILRSIPLLDQAAIDAVRQWQFTPTLLNGTPVPIMMTTTINFRL